MNLTGEILQPISEIFKTTFDGLDKLFTSDEERAKAAALLIELQGKIEIELNNGISARHESDMKSDSKLAKNIRPITLLSIVVLFVIASVASAFGFSISTNLLDILEAWGMMIFGFYFGSRGAEKIASTIGQIVRKK